MTALASGRPARSSTHPSIFDAKGQAKRLRAALSVMGIDIKHSQSQELLAAVHGERGWTTLLARLTKEAAVPSATAAEAHGRPDMVEPLAFPRRLPNMVDITSVRLGFRHGTAEHIASHVVSEAFEGSADDVGALMAKDLLKALVQVLIDLDEFRDVHDYAGVNSHTIIQNLSMRPCVTTHDPGRHCDHPYDIEVGPDVGMGIPALLFDGMCGGLANTRPLQNIIEALGPFEWSRALNGQEQSPEFMAAFTALAQPIIDHLSQGLYCGPGCGCHPA